ncbi:kin of IRRE-like protein 2 isoform X1 [Dermacentor andersoni]|uniref:kin of IRRE-like protein 2 isoform X1 n=1 Tax=Dermacentor andersoni TaxID=34620 RepID=UPI003B3B490E
MTLTKWSRVNALFSTCASELGATQTLLRAVICTILSVAAAAAPGSGGSAANNGEPPEKVVNPGESLSIPCFLETPGGSVQWMRNGHPVVLDLGSGAAGSRRQWNISRDGTAALTITQVTRADDGLWECREFADDDSVRRVTKVLKLVVTGAPEEPFLTLSGERLQEGSRVTVQEREEVEVGCVARRAVPAVRNMHWMLGETNMTAASQLFVEFSPQEDSYTTRSVLSLNASRDLHGLQLSCHVYHVSWPTSTAVAASLDVLYVPSFSISREPGFGFPILEKMPVSLHCAVDANPQSAPRWLKDDGPPPVPQSPDGYLNFSAIERHHAGWYRCAAVHRLGTFASFGYYLNVRYGPEIVEQPPSQVSADFGEPVQLDCKADGKPPPSYCWTRVRSGRLESMTSESSLMLDPVLYSDAGSYQCTATNHLGWKEERARTRNILLTISGRPDVRALNRTLTAIVGKPVRISVLVCANPPPTRAYWIVRRVLLSPGDASHAHYVANNYSSADTPFCRTTSLDIRSVHPDDGGEILFVARNPKGIDDAAVLLNVTHQASLFFTEESSFAEKPKLSWLLPAWISLFLAFSDPLRSGGS